MIRVTKSFLPSGKDLYTEDNFAEKNIQLHFLLLNKVSYQQFEEEFIPHLSILDVLMFNPAETIQKKFLLQEYSKSYKYVKSL